MEIKKTFGEVIKENKGKIIKGSLIVIGLAAGALLVLKLKAGDQVLDVVTKIEADDAEKVILGAMEAAQKIGK